MENYGEFELIQYAWRNLSDEGRKRRLFESALALMREERPDFISPFDVKPKFKVGDRVVLSDRAIKNRLILKYPKGFHTIEEIGAPYYKRRHPTIGYFLKDMMGNPVKYEVGRTSFSEESLSLAILPPLDEGDSYEGDNMRIA